MSRGEPVTGPREKRHRPDAEVMSVAAVFHRYPPSHGAGAEWMAHALLRELAARGHTVRVFCSHGITDTGTLDGVHVARWRGHVDLAGADVVVTHLDRTRDAVWAARVVGLPVVHLLHNHRQLRFHGVAPADADLVVANSHWMAESYGWWPGRLEVVHPPVDVDDYATTRRIEDRVTLVNLSAAKGGPLFWTLADRMPHRRFLAVVGAYAFQEVRRAPSNVMVLGNTPRMRDDVYALTKVLLIPSSYESWGRVGIEAACSGIPTVAHPTPGLVESLGTAAVWADRDDPDQWVDAIDLLFDDPEEYSRLSALAYTRARDLDPKLGDYDRWERMVLDVVRGHAPVR